MKLLPLLSVAVLALSACKTTGTDLASSTVDDLKQLHAELAKGQESIGAATTALDELVAEEGDMTKQYQEFAKTVERVGSHVTRVRSAREDLTGQREAFMASWNEGLAGIQNASMKERATERQQSVVAEFDALKEASATAREQFNQWYGDLVDVRSYLEFDLNPAGIESIESDIASIKERAEGITAAIDEVSTKLAGLIEALEAAKPPTPAETAETSTESDEG